MLSHAGKIVLVLEKDPAMRALLKDYLGSLGLESVCWEFPHEVSSMSRSARFDLAIADVQFIDQDERGVLWGLRAQWPQLPFLLIGAFAKATGPTSATLMTGPSCLIPKPFALVDIRKAIQVFLC